ncbi:MAG: glutaredoxin [Candidatus Endobugula sp.]
MVFTQMKKIILYHTLGCHLCDLAKEQLEPLLGPYGFRLVEIDIAEHSNSDELISRYGVRIPVIQVANSGLSIDLGWPFDTANVHAWLLEHHFINVL